MRKVRLQAVVSTQVANRLKEEADRRGTSVSAILGLAAEAFLAPKKAPPIPQKYVTEREFLELKEQLAKIVLTKESAFPVAETNPNSLIAPRVSSGLYTRTRG